VGCRSGLNYFDTAPQYGNGLSEKGFAAVLKARGRDKIFQVTKVNVFPNRTSVYQKIFRSLPDAEQEAIRNRAADEIKARVSKRRATSATTSRGRPA